MAKHIEFIARGVCIRGGYLLVCKSLAGGYCYLPGGHVEFGEFSRDALAREMLEETGLKLKVGDLLGVDECRFEQAGKGGKLKSRHEFNLLHEMHLLPRGTTRPPIPSLESRISFEWIRLTDLQSAGFKPESTRLRLAEILPRGKKQ